MRSCRTNDASHDDASPRIADTAIPRSWLSTQRLVWIPDSALCEIFEPTGAHAYSARRPSYVCLAPLMTTAQHPRVPLTTYTDAA